MQQEEKTTQTSHRQTKKSLNDTTCSSPPSDPHLGLQIHNRTVEQHSTKIGLVERAAADHSPPLL